MVEASSSLLEMAFSPAFHSPLQVWLGLAHGCPPPCGPAGHTAPLHLPLACLCGLCHALGQEACPAWSMSVRPHLRTCPPGRRQSEPEGASSSLLEMAFSPACHSPPLVYSGLVHGQAPPCGPAGHTPPLHLPPAPPGGHCHSPGLGGWGRGCGWPEGRQNLVASAQGCSAGSVADDHSPREVVGSGHVGRGYDGSSGGCGLIAGSPLEP